MTEENFEYVEEEIIEEDYDEVSLLSTIWEETSVDLSVVSEFAKLRTGRPSRLSPTPSRRSAPRPFDAPNQSSSPHSPPNTPSDSNSTPRGMSLGSFLEGNSGHRRDLPLPPLTNPTNILDDSHHERQERLGDQLLSPTKITGTPPLSSLDAFLKQPPISTETSKDVATLAAAQLLAAAAGAVAHKDDNPPPNQPNTISSTADAEQQLVKLVSLLTGEEIQVPEDDDEFTYVSYQSEGTYSLASDVKSVDAASTTDPPPPPPSSLSPRRDGDKGRPGVKRSQSVGSHSMTFSLDAIAEDSDDE